MPVFKVQAPDGTVIKIEAADQATAIRGAQEHYGSRSPRKVGAGEDMAKSFLSGAREGLASVADLVAQAGPVGQIMGGIETAANLFSPRGERSTRMAAPVSAQSAQARKTGYKPQTTGGEYARTVGQMLLNAAAPGSALARTANVFAPAILSETSGQLARGMGADETGQAVARGAGALAGAGVSSIRAPNLFRSPDPVSVIARRSRQDLPAMRGRAAQLRAAGVEPTLTDVVDDAGRGLIRAAANRQTPGRQIANDFAESRVTNLPGRMSAQARAHMSRDPRTPGEIQAAEVANRSRNANQAFGAVRGDTIDMAPETVQALRNPMGREAIAEAARRERDPEVRAALLRLSNDALDNPSTPITVGMADRISRTLFGKADAATRAGDNDLAATFNGLAQSIREPARNASPGYRGALEGFAADSRMTEASGVGEQLLTRNTDEFVSAARNLAPRERALAAAAGRRAVERKAGENPSSAIGVARALTIAPEQQARTAALLGPARAARLQAGMGAEVAAVRNARAIAPGAGSSTFLNQADDAAVSQMAGAAVDTARGNLGGLAMRAADAWRRRGMNDQQVEDLVRLATDVRQTDDAIAAIARSLDPATRQELFQLRNAVATGAIGMATGGFRSTNEERP